MPERGSVSVSDGGKGTIVGWSFDHPWESVRSVVLDNLSRLARRQKSERSGAEGLIAGRITLGFRPSWSTPLRSSPQGARNPYLAFNNFRVLKCDFGNPDQDFVCPGSRQGSKSPATLFPSEMGDYRDLRPAPRTETLVLHARLTAADETAA